MIDWRLKIIENPEDIRAVEHLQRLVWPGNETEILPVHIFVAAIRSGGLLIGAYRVSENSEITDNLIGFVYGFPGMYFTPDGPRSKHCSHMLGVHPDYRGKGLGFALKRAQWQMVRHQGLDRITWTYDPLLSRNAHLNIAKLGAVCNSYQREYYGELRDHLNIGLPSDRFEVDWWVNTKRVELRLSHRARPRLDLAHFFAAGAKIINPTKTKEGNWSHPMEEPLSIEDYEQGNNQTILLVEIPSDILAIRAAKPELALEWRMHTRTLFEDLFGRGYLVTDFVHLPGSHPRSFYVLSHGDSTL